jgi:homopolymeric O-antigen transport system permease protein
MTATATTAPAPLKPTLVVRPLALNTFRYLYRCALAVKFIPGLARRALMDLYRQTILGWWWLVFRALLPTLGIIAIFQHVPAFRPEGLSYSLYVISGMLLWTILATTMLRCIRALRRTRSIQLKVSAPKLVFVLAATSIPLVYGGIFAVVLIVGIVFEYVTSGVMYLKFGWNLALLPIPLGLAFLLGIGITSFTAVAFMFARDARLVLPLATQLWFYFTPIIYTIDIMPPSWQFAILHLNPMSPLLEMFRWSLFGVGALDLTSVGVSAAICFAVFLLGARFLMRTEWVLRELV